jgi:hypothetical protein
MTRDLGECSAAILLLLGADLKPNDICRIMRISRATYYRYRQQALELLEAGSFQDIADGRQTESPRSQREPEE